MRREDGEIATIAAAGVSNVKCIDWNSPLEVGDTCAVAITFRYQGKAGIVKAYAAIGNKQWYGFDEILDSGWKDVEVPNSPWTVTLMTWLSIPITSAISPGIYDLYGKIDGLFPDVSPTYENVIEVTGIPPVETETLEVHIDPEGAGYVTTSPPPAEGTNHFEHRDTREFEYGKIIEVTAHPAEGYIFESWSGEMTDTTDNPAPVYPMTEHRRITAHFTEMVSNFSGMIEEVKPTQFAVGDLIKILVDFKAYAHNPIDWPNWTTKLTATINGMRDEDDQSHIGEEGHRTEQPLRLGTMPDRNLSGTIKLEAKGEWLPGGWVLLDTKDITITVSGEPPTEPCSPGEWKCVGPDMWGCIDGEWVFVQANAPECVLPPEKKFPWVAAALIGGGAAVAIAAAAKKPKS